MDAGADDESDEVIEGGVGHRGVRVRRRRGRWPLRRHGRGPGAGGAVGVGAARRGRRGDGGSLREDPPNTVVRVREAAPRPSDVVTGCAGSTRLEAKRQRRRDGREAGRRRAADPDRGRVPGPPRVRRARHGVRERERPHADRGARGRRPRRALRQPRRVAPRWSATSTSAWCRTCCRPWRRRSSTSAAAATPCSTPARSTGRPPGSGASPSASSRRSSPATTSSCRSPRTRSGTRARG